MLDKDRAKTQKGGMGDDHAMCSDAWTGLKVRHSSCGNAMEPRWVKITGSGVATALAGLGRDVGSTWTPTVGSTCSYTFGQRS